MPTEPTKQPEPSAADHLLAGNIVRRYDLGLTASHITEIETELAGMIATHAQHELASERTANAKLREIPFDDEVKWILGQPCFVVRNIARRLEELGFYPVVHKSEVEQAIVAHWCLNLYLRHGASWREEGGKILCAEAAPTVATARKD